MSAERDEIDTEVEEALGRLQRPVARSEFRQELRRRFLSGSEASSPVSAASVRPLEQPTRAAGRRLVLLRVGGLLAAGLILALGYFALQGRAPRWRVLEVAQGSVVRADGVSLSLANEDELARDLQAARVIEVEKGDLIFQIGDLVLFDLGATTRVSFTGFDRAEPGVPLQVLVTDGRLRGRTGPAFQGRTMRIKADLMDVTVTGTAFALDYEPHGTCICCWDGDVQAFSEVLGSDAVRVPPKKMCLVYRGEAKSKSGDPPEKHAKPLRELDVRARELWP